MNTPTKRIVLALTPWLLALCLLFWICSYLPDDFHVRSDHGRVSLIFCAHQHTRKLAPAENYVPWSTDAILLEARTWPSTDRRFHVRGLGFEFLAHDMKWGYAI